MMHDYTLIVIEQYSNVKHLVTVLNRYNRTKIPLIISL